MSKTFADAIGTTTDNNLFDQLTTMTKAHAYDIISVKCQELEKENQQLVKGWKADKDELLTQIERVKFLENLIKEYTEKMLNNLK